MSMMRSLSMGCALSLLILGGLAAVQAQAPMVKTQAPGYYRMMLGEYEVTALSDGTMMLPMKSFMTEVTPAEVDRYLARAYIKDPTETSVNAFLVNTGAKLVLIDTGIGESAEAPGTGQLLISLKAAGYRPEQVDEVYITHMHGDHIGGLSHQGERAFPNAIVRASRLEAGYWLKPENLAAASADQKDSFQHAHEALDPYVKAGKFSPFEDGAELTPGIRGVATHGHTPGHISYLIESKGSRMWVVGDLVHLGAVQFPQPTATIKFDSDPKAAQLQRLKVFHEAAQRGDWIAAAHLSFPGIGHLRAEGTGYVWVPVNYGIPQVGAAAAH
jgi:glyoxylase-like metal-dependent hydrolase (beta-lactamase superfamily II)